MDSMTAMILLIAGLSIATIVPICLYGISQDIYEGDSTEMENKRKAMRQKSWIAIVIGVLLCIPVIFGMYEETPSTSSGTKSSYISCKWCGDSYSTTSSNGKKIRRTNFCNSCYAFYDSASNYLNEQPRNK